MSGAFAEGNVSEVPKPFGPVRELSPRREIHPDEAREVFLAAHAHTYAVIAELMADMDAYGAQITTAPTRERRAIAAVNQAATWRKLRRHLATIGAR